LLVARTAIVAHADKEEKGCRKVLTGVGFLGSPCVSSSRFRHQNAQNPPSPLVGEVGRGMRGQRCTGMQKITHLSQELYT
jgi:hypothetical protein